MAIQYDFDTRPMNPGESRDFTLTSPAPAQVEVRCFISTPPPPGYRACAECGSYAIAQGQTVQIEASQYVFSNAHGGLDITITDSDGDVVRIQLRVTIGDPDSATLTMAVAR